MTIRLKYLGNEDKANARARQNYCDALLDKANWLCLTEGLLEAAGALQPMVDAAWSSRSRWASGKESVSFPSEADAPIAIQMMLYSFAIENLLKASLVSHRKVEYEHQLKEHSVLPRELKEHDLVKLAIKAKEAAKATAELADEDEELLRRLTRRAVWSARYPVPTRYEHMAGLQKFRDGELGSISQETNADATDAQRLVHELSHELKLPLRRLGGMS